MNKAEGMLRVAMLVRYIGVRRTYYFFYGCQARKPVFIALFLIIFTHCLFVGSTWLFLVYRVF